MIEAFLKLCFFTSVLIIGYIYVGYPLSLVALAFFTSKNKLSEASDDFYPTIDLIIPAHNEEIVIAEKLDNHLALSYPDQKYQMHVLADNCTDKTVEIVKAYEKLHGHRVVLHEIVDGKGKTNAINTVIPNLDSEILVFSDANVTLGENALSEVVRSLQNDDHGGVAGQLTYVNEGESSAAESSGMYWRYEEMIKKNESKCGSIVGADGSIFAIKKQYFRMLPSFVLDDFSTSMGVVIQGGRLLYNDKIRAFEKSASEWGEEFSRKVRIANRCYNSYRFLKKELWSRLSLTDKWKLFSHRLLRWYTFVFMALAFVSNFLIALSTNRSAIWLLLIGLQFVVYVYVLLRHFGYIGSNDSTSKLASTIHYFVIANVATGIGVVQSLLGKKIVIWQKANSSR